MSLYEKITADLRARGMDVVIRGTKEEVSVRIFDTMTKQLIGGATNDSVEGAFSEVLATIVCRTTNGDMLSKL
jgi:hypothetical protein